MISFVIPAYNENNNLIALYDEISSVCKKLKKKYEVIFVNDGSHDDTQANIEALHKKHRANVRGIELRHRFGKAAALHAGFQLAKGEIIVTLDGDLQDDPKELPKFLAKIREGYDMVSGWKQNRQDSLIKNQSSKFFNAITNMISEVKLHDFNCGFKAYKAEVAQNLNIYGELHRYIPVLAAAEGYTVAEVPVAHRARTLGSSKYGSIRFIHGALDLMTVLFVTRFRVRPLHLFGYLGLGFFSLGFLGGAYLTFIKLFLGQHIGDRPLLLLSVTLMIMGVQIGVTGLVGEQITTMIHDQKPNYGIKKTI